MTSSYLNRIYETMWVPKPEKDSMDDFMTLLNRTMMGYNIMSVQILYDPPGMFSDLKAVARVQGAIVTYWREPVRAGRPMLHDKPDIHLMKANSGARKKNRKI